MLFLSLSPPIVLALAIDLKLLRHLIQLIEEAVAKVSVVGAMQEAARLRVLQGFTLLLGSFMGLLLEMVPILVPQTRKTKVE